VTLLRGGQCNRCRYTPLRSGFLPSPAKRNQIIELWEVEKFGRDSFGGLNAVSLYGMAPAKWHPQTHRSESTLP